MYSMYMVTWSGVPLCQLLNSKKSHCVLMLRGAIFILISLHSLVTVGLSRYFKQ